MSENGIRLYCSDVEDFPPESVLAIGNCLSNRRVSSGYYVREFENRFAEVNGASHAIAVNSGTAALHLALLAAGVGPESTVTVPALTYVATANAVAYCGAKLIVDDVLEDNWCLGLTDDRRASDFNIPVNLYNASVEPQESSIVDSAHAPFLYSGKALAYIYSFFASKIICCGEGGMILTEDESLADEIRLLRGQGQDLNDRRYYHRMLGYNYRMTELAAALGLGQIAHSWTIEQKMDYRRELWAHYYRNLDRTDGIILQGGNRANAWTFAVRFYGIKAESIAAHLLSVGIETRPAFYPIHQMPGIQPYIKFAGECPTACKLAEEVLLLPLHGRMSTSDVDWVCGEILGCLGGI